MRAQPVGEAERTEMATALERIEKAALAHPAPTILTKQLADPVDAHRRVFVDSWCLPLASVSLVVEFATPGQFFATTRWAGSRGRSLTHVQDCTLGLGPIHS